MSKTKQLDGLSETNHHETFNTIVEVCRVSGINFTTMYTTNTSTAIKILCKDEKITISGEYMDGKYFKMNDDERKLVNNMGRNLT